MLGLWRAGGVIELADNGTLRLTLDPQNGAAVRAFDFLNGEGVWVPVLQPADAGDPTADGSAMFPMVPFANRARENVLRIGTAAIPLSPNTADPLAIHGFGWQRVWRVAKEDTRSCALILDVDPDLPLRFEARIEVLLGRDGTEFALETTNLAAEPIPAGLGWHPFFPHRNRTTLQFDSDRFWLEGPDHLPTDPLSVPPELDFSVSRAIPASWRNNCYEAWSGCAEIVQPDLGYRLEMSADAPLDHLMLYAPQSGVFALEPQSHVSGRTCVTEGGLMALPPGGTLASRLRLSVSPIFDDPTRHSGWAPSH